MDSAQMNAMGRKYPFGQKMKRRGNFHIGAHNTKYILPVCTQKVKHICTKIKETSGNFPAIWQTPGRAFSLTTEKPHDKIQNILSAGVVELVDSVDLGSSGIAVQVRVLSPAPKIMATRMGSHYFWFVHHTGLEPIKCPGPVDPGCSPAGRGALPDSIESCHPKKDKSLRLVLFSVKSTLRVGEIPLRGVKSLWRWLITPRRKWFSGRFRRFRRAGERRRRVFLPIGCRPLRGWGWTARVRCIRTGARPGRSR